MSAELIGIISIGLGLFLANVGLFAWLRSDNVTLRREMREEFTAVRREMNSHRDELRGEIGEVRTEIGEVRTEITELKGEVAQLRERMAHLEGLLDGLREAIAVRVAS